MTVLIFDTETTGKWNYAACSTDVSQPHLVELGAILEDDDGNARVEINLLVRPNGWTIPAEVTAIHGVTQEQAEAEGIALANVAYVFRDLCANATHVVAHNIDFDRRVIIRTLFDAEVPEIPWDRVSQRCTMLTATPIVKVPKASGRGNKWPKLTEAHQFFFNEPVVGAHQAMTDVRACRAIYHELVKLGAFN